MSGRVTMEPSHACWGSTVAPRRIAPRRIDNDTCSVEPPLVCRRHRSRLSANAGSGVKVSASRQQLKALTIQSLLAMMRGTRWQNKLFTSGHK